MARPEFQLIVPISKVDTARRLVYGKAAWETADYSGEKLDYDTSKPHFEALAAACKAVSGGKKVAPLREMHQLKAAGNVEEFGFDDDGKTIYARSYVSDDDAWQKVLDGVYCCYSIGGSYMKRWDDTADASKRYTAKPSELSLVDLGMIPDTGIEMLRAMTCEVTKADGSVEQRPLMKADKTPYGNVTYADPGYQSDKQKRYPIDTEEHIRAAWSYINKEKNAGKYSSSQVNSIRRKIVAAWRSKIDAKGPPSASSKAMQWVAFQLGKGYGLYNVQTLAGLLASLDYLLECVEREQLTEGDDTQVPGDLRDAVEALADVLVTLTQEEVAELKNDTDAGDTSYAMAFAATAAGALAKAGKRNSQADQNRLQAIHDMTIALGAGCMTGDNMDAEKIRKAAAAAARGDDDMNLDELNKALETQLGKALGGLDERITKGAGTVVEGVVSKALAEDGAITKAIATSIEKAMGPTTEALGKVNTQLAAIDTRLKKVEDTPAAGTLPVRIAPEKAGDTTTGVIVAGAEAVQKAVDAKDGVGAIKAIHASFGRPFNPLE